MQWSLVAQIVYTTAWSLSFYGQVYDNYQLKNVQGFSLNYLVLNINGYILYTIYSSVGYFTDIKGAGTVRIADLIFVYHAILIVAFLTYQTFIYPRGENKVSKSIWIIIITIWSIIFLEFLLTVPFKVFEWDQYWNPLSVTGYGKLAISFIKYSPAVYWNYKRKSTKGWSIFNIIFDLIGGSLSFLSGSISLENGLNITKLILGALTIIYDIIFIIQHYVIYRPRKPKFDSYITVQQDSNQPNNNTNENNKPLLTQQQD